MSVLIKDAKVPKSCAECDFIEYDDEYEFECWCPILRINVEEYTAEKYAGCPLVEIPPHGDLVDRDKLMDVMEHEFHDKTPSSTDVLLRLAFAPTVIESEGEQ